MNFLSHYYLSSESKNEYYTLGVLLPDLIPGFTRVNKLKSTATIYTEVEKEINAGVAFHLRTDAIFHNLALFNQLNSEVTQIFSADSNHKIPRSFFLAHVLVELLIDKFLIEENLSAAQQFYFNLEKIDVVVLNTYLEKIKYLDSNFISRFDNFKVRRFAFLLDSNENMFQALKHICFHRINFRPTEAEELLLLVLIKKSTKVVEQEWKNVFKQMQKKLAEYDN